MGTSKFNKEYVDPAYWTEEADYKGLYWVVLGKIKQGPQHGAYSDVGRKNPVGEGNLRGVLYD